MAKGYLIARAAVIDPEAWAAYAALATEAQKIYGAKILVRGGRTEIVEGEGRARNIVLEFESFEAARAYAHSPEYQAAKKLRAKAGILDMVLVEGP